MKNAPGPRGSRVLHYLNLRRTDPVGFYTGLFSEYGDFVGLKFGPFSAFISGSPDAARHVFLDQHRKYSKGAFAERMSRLLGSGLITTEGALWRRQRQMIHPAFTTERLKGFSETIIQVTDRHIQATVPGERDFGKEITALTLRVAAESLLGSDLGSDVERVERAFTEVLGHMERMLLSPARLLELLPDWRGLRSVRHILYSRGRAPGRSLDDSISELDDVVRNVITARRRSPAEQPNLVSICIAARDKETGEGMSDQQIRDQVLTFLLAGHETTATALTWSALELAWNPEVAGKLKAELDSILQGRTPAYSDLPQLKYTRAVFEESMRAHPPVWRISRTALEDDEVAGFRVPKGSTVVISPLLLHHNPSLWSHPERFRPDRFLKSAKADQEAKSRFTYIPFGVGPRMCIGYHFATIEATIILASYCQRFRFRVDAGFRPALDPRVTLRIQGEATMLLEEAHAR